MTATPSSWLHDEGGPWYTQHAHARSPKGKQQLELGVVSKRCVASHPRLERGESGYDGRAGGDEEAFAEPAPVLTHGYDRQRLLCTHRRLEDGPNWQPQLA